MFRKCIGILQTIETLGAFGESNCRSVRRSQSIANARSFGTCAKYGAQCTLPSSAKSVNSRMCEKPA